MNNSVPLSHGLILQLGWGSFFLLWQHFNISHTNIVLGARNELDSLCFQSSTWNTLSSFSEGMSASSPSEKGNWSWRSWTPAVQTQLKVLQVYLETVHWSQLVSERFTAFHSFCTFPLFCFSPLRANSCNIKHEHVMGKMLLNGNLTLTLQYQRFIFFGEVNETKWQGDLVESRSPKAE